MRGTPHDVFVGECHIGIIPAYAGNTFRPVMVGVRPRDHPRVCGEHALLANANAEPLGSSPRMRGTQSSSAKSDYRRGIIPAYAGNTEFHLTISLKSRDHPLVCGEHRKETFFKDIQEGSSPRMRGTLAIVSYYDSDVGIIPAYAGNTFFLPPSRRTVWDHPRVCGEHPWMLPTLPIVAGSSPRMRGTPPCRPHQRRPAGIIPAYAGNT